MDMEWSSTRTKYAKDTTEAWTTSLGAVTIHGAEALEEQTVMMDELRMRGTTSEIGTAAASTVESGIATAVGDFRPRFTTNRYMIKMIPNVIYLCIMHF